MEKSELTPCSFIESKALDSIKLIIFKYDDWPYFNWKTNETKTVEGVAMTTSQSGQCLAENMT